MAQIVYPSISGLSRVPLGEPCWAFHKYDGSNLRFFWTKQAGWHRFGTRYRWLKPQTPLFGPAFNLFRAKFADGIAQVLRSHKDYRGAGEVVAFCEFFGPSSFAGFHDEAEPKELVLIDVHVRGRGLILPEEFVAQFGHLRIAELVYQGPFTRPFIEEVRAGKYPVKEGVVAKGVRERVRRKGKVERAVWLAKVKTNTWLEELRKRAGDSEDLRRQLQENEQEQVVGEAGLPDEAPMDEEEEP